MPPMRMILCFWLPRPVAPYIPVAHQPGGQSITCGMTKDTAASTEWITSSFDLMLSWFSSILMPKMILALFVVDVLLIVTEST
jgi:hypothetical protein